MIKFYYNNKENHNSFDVALNWPPFGKTQIQICNLVITIKRAILTLMTYLVNIHQYNLKSAFKINW